MTVTFDPEKHLYFLDGKRLESVSEILKASGLKQETPPRYDFQWYLDRGRKVHEALELNDIGFLDENSLDERIRGYVKSWRSLGRKYHKSEIEMRLHDPTYHYAGTADRIDCELKTGSPEPWHLYQVSAYWKILGGGKFHIVYLKEDGSTPTLKYFDYPTLKRALDTFLSALNVVRAKREMYGEERE